MTTRESPVTEREQQALEHMRKAQELRTTLKEYAATVGLDVRQLYEDRRRLVRKGVLGPSWGKAKEPDKVGTFLPVRIVSSPSAPGSSSVVCRLVHPSGWVFECSGFPPASWMAAVLAGGAHAAA